MLCIVIFGPPEISGDGATISSVESRCLPRPKLDVWFDEIWALLPNI